MSGRGTGDPVSIVDNGSAGRSAERGRLAQRGASMPTMGLLMGLVGQAVGADTVRAVITSDSLVLSSDPFLVERRYLSGPEVGYELMHIEGRIDTAFIFLVATEGYRPFRGPLVAGLSSRSTRSDVRQRL